jgi:hypothetical protein
MIIQEGYLIIPIRFAAKQALFWIAALSMVTGPLIALLPRQTVEFQIALYRMISWKLEPMSWEREVRDVCRDMLSVLIGYIVCHVVWPYEGQNYIPDISIR